MAGGPGNDPGHLLSKSSICSNRFTPNKLSGELCLLPSPIVKRTAHNREYSGLGHATRTRTFYAPNVVDYQLSQSENKNGGDHRNRTDRSLLAKQSRPPWYMGPRKWCFVRGLNSRPWPCKGPALPLS